jgi:hypothetical protein
MANNRVQVQIDGNDYLTPILDRMLDKMRDGVFQGGLLGKAFDAAFDLGSKAIGGFMKSLEDASEATLANIKTVGALSTTIGASFEVTDRLNNKIIKGLAEQAAVLPGTTDDYVKFYRSVTDNVANASKEISGGVFSADQFEKQITKVSSKFTVLGGKLTAAQNIKTFESLMGGRSIKQLEKLTYFMQNPALMQGIKATLKTDFGGKDISKLTKGARLQVVMKALDMALTDDTVARLSNTLDAYKESFLSKIFDPTIGLFGWLRDVDGNLENGVQTAYQGVTDFVGSIIGDKGVLTAMGGMLNAMGFKFVDPMAQIRFYSMRAANFFNSVAAKLRYMSTFGNIDEGISTIQSWFIQAPIAVMSWALKNVRELMNLINKSNFGENVGKFIATMFNGLAGNLSGGQSNIGIELLKTVAYVGVTVVKAIGSGLMTFLTNLSPETLITIGSATLLSIGIGSMLAQLAAYLGGTFLVANIIPGVLSLLMAAVGIAGPGLILAAIAAIGLLGAVIVKHWGEISQMAGDIFTNIGQIFVGIGQVISGILTLNTASIVDGIKSICSGLMDLVNKARDAIAIVTGGTTSGQASANSAMATAEARYQAALAKKTNSNFAGFIPNTGIGGLLDAVLRESAAMPSGSAVTIANSSEAILTAGQQSTLVGAIGGGRSSSVGGGTFAPTINVYGSQGQDISQLASLVMAAIQEQFNDYSAGMLV